MIREHIFELINQERDRQDRLHGSIDRYIGHPVFGEDGFQPHIQGWKEILEEEVCEAIMADTKYDRITELIQVAAVCVKWIEVLTYEDRNKI